MTLIWHRPKPYQEYPKTFGEHLLKRRIESGKTQGQVAFRLSVNEWTYLLWEKDRTKPMTRYYPALFRFLGYDPFPAPKTLGERLRHKRMELGLSIREAARIAGVDEGTFARWEDGKWRPRSSQKAVQRFLEAK